jgi:hypothetical protein
VLPANLGLGAMTVISIELYDDGVVVRWLSAPPPSPSDFDLALLDDAGTAYSPAGSGGYGNEHVLRGESTFVPSVPRAAKRLTLQLMGSAVTIDL